MMAKNDDSNSKNSDNGEQRGGSHVSDTVALTLTPPEQWRRRGEHHAATPGHQSRHLPGDRCCGGNNCGDEGHGTTVSGDGRQAVAVATAVDQVEAEESWMVVVASDK